jgi:hypothetical protein
VASVARSGPLRAHRPQPPAGTGWADPSAALFSITDTLSLIIFPWFLMGAYHSLLDLTLKAAYAAVVVAALAAGNDVGRRLAPVTWPGGARRNVLVLAGLMAVCAGVLYVVPQGTSVDALVCTAGAMGTGLLLGSVRPLPRRSFPFAPRLPAAGSLAAVDLAAFAAVLAMLLLTATGSILAFVLIAALYAALAAFGNLDAGLDLAAAEASEVMEEQPPPPLPRRLERAVTWTYRVLIGQTGIERAPVVSDAAALAFQVLFALAVYKIVVHMEFTALALGLLMACGAMGEFATRGFVRYLNTPRHATVALVAGGLWTIGMFAGLAGSAFPPLEFVFWAGAAAGAATIDRARARLAALQPRRGILPVSPMLGTPRLVVMVFAGYLVWWLSTLIAKPHSINLVLTMAGLTVGAALAWVVLPAAIGQHNLRERTAPPGGRPRVVRSRDHAVVGAQRIHRHPEP